MDDEPRAKSLLAALCGAIDRHVKQRPRDTIVRNAREDPAKPLAQRVSESDACDFCSQFANAEPVDPAKVSEKFHAYCKCHFMLFFQETRYRGRFVDDDALESVGITIEEGATPDYYEKRDGLVMAALGHRVEFLKRHLSGARRADTLIDGELVEFKNPKGSGVYTVQRQIKSMLYGKNKEVMKPQSDVLLISNVRNSMTMFEMQESLAFAYGPNSLLTAEEKAAIRKIILMDERTRRVRVYEMKEPALHGSGPRRRQGNNSIGETKPQEVRLTRMTHAASSTEEHRSPKPTTEVRPLGGVPGDGMHRRSLDSRLTNHAMDQMEERGVSIDDVVDADKNPLHRRPTKIDELGRPSYQQIGRNATIVVNPETNEIPSVWPTGTKDRRRYERNGNRGIVDGTDSPS